MKDGKTSVIVVLSTDGKIAVSYKRCLELDF